MFKTKWITALEYTGTNVYEYKNKFNMLRPISFEFNMIWKGSEKYVVIILNYFSNIKSRECITNLKTHNCKIILENYEKYYLTGFIKL